VRVFRDPTEVEPVGAGRAVAIGAFDGVHLGHREILRLVHELARARGLGATVVTFDRHPAEVVRPESAPLLLLLLTTLDQKLALLDQTGFVDECLVLTFDDTRSKEPAEDFVEEILAGVLRTRLVVVGDDFHFGFRRRGDVALLRRMGADLGFEVVDLGLVAAPGGAVAAPGAPVYSSTRVRELLAAGDVACAAGVLGRPHEVVGVVERGDGRGRELGFPTANISLPARTCLPDEGVYAGTVTAADGVERGAALSLGRRATFYDAGDLLLEAYVVDFDGDLYGQRVRVRFTDRVRGQLRFSGPDAVGELVAQMERDVARVRELLAP
jgi:riboflavin kinase/FMN adenylyltransferase